MLTVLTSNYEVTAAVTVAIFVVLRYLVKHFRRLWHIRKLLPRVPVAISDEMILEHGLTSCRSANRFACRATLQGEEFNEQLDVCADQFQHARVYPLMSKMSLVAAVLSILSLILIGVLLLGQIDAPAQAGLPTSGPNANIRAEASSAAKQLESVDTSTFASRGATAISDASRRHAVLEALPEAGIVVAIVFSLFVAFLMTCYYIFVRYVLAEEVIKLCETVDLVVVTSDIPGRPKIKMIVKATDDADFKALLRLV